MELESIAQVRLEPRFKPDLHQDLLVGKNILAPKMAISKNALVEKPAGQIVPQTEDVNLEPVEQNVKAMVEQNHRIARPLS